MNRYRVENLKQPYLPFVNEVTSVRDLLTTYAEAKAPIFRNKKLLILRTEMNFPFFRNYCQKLLDINNINADVLTIIKMKERFYDYPTSHINIIELNKGFRDDFINYTRSILPQITEDGMSELIRRIGLSKKNLEYYLHKLKKLEIIGYSQINKIVTMEVLPPINEILKGILERSPKYYRYHLKLCNKYSESWVLEFYRETLEEVLQYKYKVFHSGMSTRCVNTPSTLKYKRLVLGSNTYQVFQLKNLLCSNQKDIAIELYMKETSWRNLKG